jgi:cytochrome c-type biogenesis protein CcmH
VTGFVLLAALMALAAAAFVAWPLLRSATPSRVLGGAFIVLIPLASGLYYAAVSRDFWRQPDQRAADALHPGSMVASLEARLRQAPDDPTGWMLLGRSYQVLQEYPRSAAAYERAVKLTQQNNVDALIGLGEALVATDDTAITGRAGQLFERSFELAPDDPRALWYAGFASFRRGDVAATRARWQKLSAHDLPPEIRTELDRALASIDAASPGGAKQTGPAATEGGTALRIRVDLAPALASAAPPTATLFIFVRDGGAAGPPLAVVRRSLGAWPVEVTLTQADVMLPGRRLAELAGTRVVARVSMRGEPRASSGDLFGEASVASIGKDPVAVLIDSKVP